jgi:hypothetical protein
VISSSKLQLHLELCRFVHALLKIKFAKWKVHFLLRICETAHVQHSSEWMAYYSRYATEKKGCCPWSRIAITSHILALKLTASQRLILRSLSLLLESSLDFHKYCLRIVHSQPRVLLGSRLTSNHTMAIPQPFTILLYWCLCIAFSSEYPT